MSRTAPPLVLMLAAVWLLPGPCRAADWQAVAGEFIRSEKPGYGGLCGLIVDHRTGDVLIDLSDRGVYWSGDQAKSWRRLGGEIKGRTEWPGCLTLDPTGKSRRLLTALVYGSPVVVAAEPGAAWRPMDAKSAHVDWCAVDWNGPGPDLVLALKHESGGLLIVSRDGGRSFEEVGKGYGPAWVFDDHTAVVAEARTRDRPHPGLLRTTDGARTFKPCASHSAQALPRWHDGTLYWVVEGALIASRDRGETWQMIGPLKDGRYGPVFGKDPGQMFVLTGGGIVESADGGATWGKPIPLPAELKPVGPLTWIDYDPQHDVLYAMKMGSALYRMACGR